MVSGGRKSVPVCSIVGIIANAHGIYKPAIQERALGCLKLGEAGKHKYFEMPNLVVFWAVVLTYYCF